MVVESSIAVIFHVTITLLNPQVTVKNRGIKLTVNPVFPIWYHISL